MSRYLRKNSSISSYFIPDISLDTMSGSMVPLKGVCDLRIISCLNGNAYGDILLFLFFLSTCLSVPKVCA